MAQKAFIKGQQLFQGDISYFFWLLQGQVYIL